jgi:hypothetical protein
MDCVLSNVIYCCYGYCPKHPQTISEYKEYHKKCKESINNKSL